MQKGILITGGGHGIGKQICRVFLEAGAQVCFIDLIKKDPSHLRLNIPICFIFMAMLPVR